MELLSTVVETSPAWRYWAAWLPPGPGPPDFSYPGREAAAVPNAEYWFQLTGDVPVVRAPAEINITASADLGAVAVVPTQVRGDGVAR